MASETLYKFDPRRTMSLRPNPLTATTTAAIHDVSASGFKVSGTFRDRVDYAILDLFHADEYFGHPRWHPLPHFDFDGLTLQFDVSYSGLEPFESPKFAWVDWDVLLVEEDAGTLHKVRLTDYATRLSGYSPAGLTVGFTVGGGGVANGDRLTLTYFNRAFDLWPNIEVRYGYLAGGAGTSHTVTVDGTTYTYVEQVGDTNTAIAVALAALVNDSASSPPSPDPNVTASNDSDPGHSNELILTRKLDDGTTFMVSSNCTGLNSGNSFEMTHVTTSTGVALWFTREINAADWIALGYVYALLAAASGGNLTLTASRAGTVNTSGTAVSWVSGPKFFGIVATDTFRINGVNYTVSSVTDPENLVLTATAGSQSGAPYVAPRGGYDGNMLVVYETHATSNMTASAGAFSGGDSSGGWRITLPFDFLVDNAAASVPTTLRRVSLLFAPMLTEDAAAYQNTEWTATFSNLSVTDASPPTGNRTLKVADQTKSVHVGALSSWCSFAGTWTTGYGNGYRDGVIRETLASGASVTVEIHCQYTHDLYIGTVLGAGLSNVTVTVDGDTPTALDTDSVAGAAAIVARRKVRSGLSAGAHSVVITNGAALQFVFNYVEAVVEGDVLDAPETRTEVGWATDYDTDHSYRVPADYLVWQIQRSGLVGPINHFGGILYLFPRQPSGHVFSEQSFTVGGTWAESDTCTISFGGVEIIKTVTANDTTSTIAAHFAYYINAVFSAVRAQVSGAVLTVIIRSPVDTVNWESSVASAYGTISPEGTGTLGPGTLGAYVLDDTATPVLDLAAREWHADFFAAAAAASIDVIFALSMEFTNPPDEADASPPGAVWSARHWGAGANGAGGAEAIFEIVPGFNGTHCTFAPAVLAFQKAVALYVAGLQNTAGLDIWLQFGEFLWWYVSNYAAGPGTGGMAFYDNYIREDANTTLGHYLPRFTTTNDTPTPSGDIAYLQAKLWAYIDAIIDHVVATYAAAQFEILWARDVNQDTQQLNLAVNTPAEIKSAAAGLDRFKMECLSFSAFEKDVDKAIEAMQYPYTASGWSWARSATWYNLPVLQAAAPWVHEFLRWAREGHAGVSLWALDHYFLRGEPLPLPAELPRAYAG